jgi:hypothetical protein
MNLQVITNIDRKTWDFGYYFYLFVGIIMEQHRDQEECK